MISHDTQKNKRRKRFLWRSFHIWHLYLLSVVVGWLILGLNFFIQPAQSMIQVTFWRFRVILWFFWLNSIFLVCSPLHWGNDPSSIRTCNTQELGDLTQAFHIDTVRQLVTIVDLSCYGAFYFWPPSSTFSPVPTCTSAARGKNQITIKHLELPASKCPTFCCSSQDLGFATLVSRSWLCSEVANMHAGLHRRAGCGLTGAHSGRFCPIPKLTIRTNI